MTFTSGSGTIVMEDQGTLRVSGNVTWQKNYPEWDNPPDPNDSSQTVPVDSTIHVDAGGTLLFRAQIRNDRTSIPSLHTIHLDGPGTVKLTNSGSNGSVDASLFGGSWDVSNGTLILGQNSETGGSSGDTLNAIGFKYGDPTLPNTVTVRDTGVLVGTENAHNGAFNIDYYKGYVVLAGGTLASGNGKDTSWGGDFATADATTSTIATYDPTDPTTARSVSLVGGDGGLGSPSSYNTTWAGNLVIDSGPNSVTGGAFNISRQGGSVTVSPGLTFQVNQNAALNVDSPLDILSDGTNSVSITNNSTTTTGFTISNGTKNIGALDGTGNTTIVAGTNLNADHLRQNSVTLNGNAVVREDANPYGSDKRHQQNRHADHGSKFQAEFDQQQAHHRQRHRDVQRIGLYRCPRTGPIRSQRRDMGRPRHHHQRIQRNGGRQLPDDPRRRIRCRC